MIIQRHKEIFEAGVLKRKANSPAGGLGTAPQMLIRIVWHKIIGNFPFVNNLMIPIKQYNDHIYS